MKPPVLTSTDVRPLACSTSRASLRGRSCRQAVYAPSLRAMELIAFRSVRGGQAGGAGLAGAPAWVGAAVDAEPTSTGAPSAWADATTAWRISMVCSPSAKDALG